MPGTVVTVTRDRQVVASCEYDWVRDYDDLLRADRDEPPFGGEVLYISNLTIPGQDRRLIWQLRARLPKARWIVGLTKAWELRAPKGVPDGFVTFPA